MRYTLKYFIFKLDLNVKVVYRKKTFKKVFSEISQNS